MKKPFFKFNFIGTACIVVGGIFIFFNIPAYMWLILLGVALIVTGVYLCK